MSSQSSALRSTRSSGIVSVATAKRVELTESSPVFRPSKRAALALVAEHPLVSTRRCGYYDFAKRCFDLIGALLIALLTAPLMFAVAIGVKLSSEGPIILKQQRLTQGGRAFTLLKFRSMRQDAEKNTGAVFAGARDPRVTAFGRFIRKTRLDELPQLLNVIRGEMSLIGPRPERPEVARELKTTIPGFDKRLNAKAGLTGLAQVVQGYPDDLKGYRKKLAWDVVYIRKQSLLLDLWIALQTVRVIITGSGAR